MPATTSAGHDNLYIVNSGSGKILIESAYLPPISWFTFAAAAGEVWLDKHEHFEKRSYRNRCHIAGPNGMLRLTVPLMSGKHMLPMSDVKICNTENWQEHHWRSICTSYRRSPFFEFYEDRLAPFYQIPQTSIFGLNRDLIIALSGMMGLELNLFASTSFMARPGDDMADLRSLLRPNGPYAGYAEGFRAPVYQQVFGNRTGFLADLSIIDLLFNAGPEACVIIRNPALREDPNP